MNEPASQEDEAARAMSRLVHPMMIASNEIEAATLATDRANEAFVDLGAVLLDYQIARMRTALQWVLDHPKAERALVEKMVRDGIGFEVPGHDGYPLDAER